MMNRRDFLLGSAAAAGLAGGAAWTGASLAAVQELAVQPASFTFRNQPTRGMVSLSPDAPPPVICGRQGQPVHLRVSNRTPDYTAMHWHGLRIANAMDGVPYLTPMPIAGGESFGYEFTPPDAGTYWYHPHCMSMAQLRAAGRTLARDLRELKPLPPDPVSRPDLAKAELLDFVFGWTPEGRAPNDGFCGAMGYSFWSINRTPWAGDAAKGTGPLAPLGLGKSYVLRLRNELPNLHPIHLHGLAFVPIRSNRRRLPPLVTDTLLLLKDEVVEIALVADNPGDWAFHCHVIEHQKTGLAGFLRVA